VQRKLAKAEIGTPERASRRKVVAQVYQRMVNRRKDFTHQLSRSIVNAYGLIALEKLNTQGMLQNHCLAKSIADAAWHQLVRFTLYKAKKLVERAYWLIPTVPRRIVLAVAGW